MRFNLFKITLNIFIFFVVLSTWSLNSAKATLEEEKTVIHTFPRQPQLDDLSRRQLNKTIAKAEQGDEEAQDQVIELNYWGLLPTQEQCGLWSTGTGRGTRKVNPILWNNTEERAITDSRYAYALINNYSHILRWDRRAPSFAVQFPNLFRSILDNAEGGDICAGFIMGVLYIQFQNFPERIGFQEKPEGPRNLGLKLVKRSATQGHSLAKSAMGLLSYQGYVTQKGREEIEPLQWYIASKENKISQDALRHLLLCPRKPREQEGGSFQEEVTEIKETLEAVWGRHIMSIKLHEPGGDFEDMQFKIPQLALHYKEITGVEEEALELLRSLEIAAPGLLMTGVIIRERRDRERMLNGQTVLYVSVTLIDGTEYLTLGEDNVSLASRLLTYVNGIEDRFSEATESLWQVGRYYETQLELALGKLIKRRLQALAKKDTDSLQRFEKQKKSLEELEALFEAPLTEIKEECELLSEVKESIKNIVTRNGRLRSQDFLKEHPFL